jgi:NAD(P)-dependent dehydrogenase (short-subunit alcohol dehydrogenase family)
MTESRKVAIVTGASKGIGAGAAEALLAKGYSVVANSRSILRDNPFKASPRLALVAGDIGEHSTAASIVDMALSRFGRIDALINNAGIFLPKSFTDYTFEDLKSLLAVNVEGFVFITQLAIKQMVAQRSGGNVVNITTSLAQHPIAGVNCAVPMITKGGLEAVTRSLAMEYVKENIRVNAVAPGIVDTPMHKDDPMDFLKTLQPMGQVAKVKDVVDAIVYLMEAAQVTGEVLHVDGGAHAGKW